MSSLAVRCNSAFLDYRRLALTAVDILASVEPTPLVRPYTGIIHLYLRGDSGIRVDEWSTTCNQSTCNYISAWVRIPCASATHLLSVGEFT